MTQGKPAHWVDVTANEMTVPAPSGWTRALFSVAEAVFSTHDGAPPALRLQWLCVRVREFVDDVGGKAGFVFRFSLWAVNWIAPVWALSLPPFTSKSLERRLHMLEKWERSPFGLTLLAIKAFMSMQYFEHPDVADEVGFDPQGRP